MFRAHTHTHKSYVSEQTHVCVQYDVIQTKHNYRYAYAHVDYLVKCE